MADEQKRVLLWAVPRSTSTAFLRSIQNRPNTKVLVGPFGNAYFQGSERVSKRYIDTLPIMEETSFLDVKERYEETYPGVDLVFGKEMAFWLDGRIDGDHIPSGFKHTFLIRHPRETVTSFYNVITNKIAKGFEHFEPGEVGFKELYEMYKYVTETLGQDPVIVDSRDMLSNPEMMMKLYCERLGISFDDKMLNWSDKPQDLKPFTQEEIWVPWFSELLKQKTFRPYRPPPEVELPKVYQDAIDDNMPYYQELYNHRIKID